MSDLTTKAWWSSTTIQGQIITVVMFLLTIFKVNWLNQEQVTLVVTALLAIVGVVMSVYGRIKAGEEPVKLGWK